jgi:hypothetical protein
MLEKVRYKDYEKGINVEVFTDSYAYDRYLNIYLLSVTGHDSTVKAITSALVSGRELEILSDYPVYISTGFSQKYRILGTKLGNGLLHQVVLEDGFFRSYGNGYKLLLVGKEESAPDKVYHAVRKSCSVPMIPEWSDWLYGRIKEENGLEELMGTKKVLKLTIGEEELDTIISDGVESGEIKF